jgi:hypothetical protein
MILFSGCALPALPSLTTTTATGGGGQERPSGPVYDEDTTSYGFYYDQLSDNEKAIYRAIYKNARTATEISFALKTPLVVTTPATDGDEAHTAAISAAVKRIIQPAMDALAYDHPEIAWMAYGGLEGSSFSISVKSEARDGNKISEVGALTFMMKFKDGITKDTVADFEAEMNAAIAQITDTLTEIADDRYACLIAIQNALAERVSYDKTGERAHEAAGALLDGLAVCDGYAKAFKLLCDKMGIPCVIVAGTAKQNGSEEPHAWNYVQMEDGLYYAVDLTWNDDGELASTDYFLVGAETVPAAGRAPFIESHLADGKFSAGDYPPFTFPVLAASRYSN